MKTLKIERLTGNSLILVCSMMPHCSFARGPRFPVQDRHESALPERAIKYHGIEDGQQYAGDRDDGNSLGLAGCHAVLEEGLEHGVMSPGHKGAMTGLCARSPCRCR
jgi:hypothetical protein